MSFDLFDLPDYVILEYLERLDDEDLFNTCTASKHLRNLCMSRGDLRKRMGKLAKVVEVTYSVVSEDGGSEEDIKSEEVRLTEKNWNELRKFANDNEHHKIYIDVDDHYIVIHDDGFYISDGDRDGEIISAEEARELSGF